MTILPCYCFYFRQRGWTQCDEDYLTSSIPYSFFLPRVFAVMSLPLPLPWAIATAKFPVVCEIFSIVTSSEMLLFSGCLHGPLQQNKYRDRETHSYNTFILFQVLNGWSIQRARCLVYFVYRCKPSFEWGNRKLLRNKYIWVSLIASSFVRQSFHMVVCCCSCSFTFPSYILRIKYSLLKWQWQPKPWR